MIEILVLNPNDRGWKDAHNCAHKWQWHLTHWFNIQNNTTPNPKDRNDRDPGPKP